MRGARLRSLLLPRIVLLLPHDRWGGDTLTTREMNRDRPRYDLQIHQVSPERRGRLDPVRFVEVCGTSMAADSSKERRGQ